MLTSTGGTLCYHRDMPEFIKTAEVIGNVAKATYDLGSFVAKRLFTVGAWTGEQFQPSVDPANIQVHDSQPPVDYGE